MKRKYGFLLIANFLLRLISFYPDFRSVDFILGCLQPSLIGDGNCNDVTNNQLCHFDGGDCCLLNVNTYYCSNCSCSDSGVINSPGFPGNYDNNLDLTWLIQLPPGQLILINFISFDVEFQSSCRLIEFYLMQQKTFLTE